MTEDGNQDTGWTAGDGGDAMLPATRPTGPPERKRRSSPDGAVGRIPPQAMAVERSVLGAMLIDRTAIPKVIANLPEDAFYSSKHQKVYRAILGLFERSNPVDQLTVEEELKRNGTLEEVGGAFYLAELTTRVASAANVEHYARIVAEKSLLRKLIETMTSMITKAYDPSADAFLVMDEAEGEIFRVSDSHLRKPAISLYSAIYDTMQRLEKIQHQTTGVIGVPSGFRVLDQLTGGWQNSDLIIVAARPSMGKTAFALSIARNAATDKDKPTPVAIFSLEMSAQQLAQRLLCMDARIDAQAARTGRMNQEEWIRLAGAASRLSDAPIFIDDTPALSILELRAKCRRLKADKDIGLVVVDYLQLMHGTGQGKQSSREQEIAQISRSLKALAKELDLPVIALSQLSRAVESRPDKIPQLSDLRESGSIEQDADVVAFIYRAEYYKIPNAPEGVGEIILGKQRNGPVGTAELAYIKNYARFENLDRFYTPTDVPGDEPMDSGPAPF